MLDLGTDPSYNISINKGETISIHSLIMKSSESLIKKYLIEYNDREYFAYDYDNLDVKEFVNSLGIEHNNCSQVKLVKYV